MDHMKSKILLFMNEYSSIFTRNFFRENINGEKITINSANYVLDCSEFYALLDRKTNSVNIHELLYMIFFISKLRSYFHFSDKSMEIINIKLVRIENILFNLLLENDNNIDLDEIINITNDLSTSVKFLNYEMCKNKSYKKTYTKFLCICIKIAPIAPISTIIPM